MLLTHVRMDFVLVEKEKRTCFSSGVVLKEINPKPLCFGSDKLFGQDYHLCL